MQMNTGIDPTLRHSHRFFFQLEQMLLGSFILETEGLNNILLMTLVFQCRAFILNHHSPKVFRLQNAFTYIICNKTGTEEKNLMKIFLFRCCIFILLLLFVGQYEN